MKLEYLQSKVKELRLTQKEIARDMLVTEGAVSLWLSGQRSMPLSMQKLFCFCYDLPFNNPPAGIEDLDLYPDLFPDYEEETEHLQEGPDGRFYS